MKDYFVDYAIGLKIKLGWIIMKNKNQDLKLKGNKINKIKKMLLFACFFEN